jgi:hypothetical protein
MSSLPPGRMLGPYEILSPIGAVRIGVVCWPLCAGLPLLLSRFQPANQEG